MEAVVDMSLKIEAAKGCTMSSVNDRCIEGAVLHLGNPKTGNAGRLLIEPTADCHYSKLGNLLIV